MEERETLMEGVRKRKSEGGRGDRRREDDTLRGGWTVWGENRREITNEGREFGHQATSSAHLARRDHWPFTHHTIVIRIALRRILGVWHMLKKPELVWYCAELTLRAC